jgi:hypothetical protein
VVRRVAARPWVGAAGGGGALGRGRLEHGGEVVVDEVEGVDGADTAHHDPSFERAFEA